MNYGMTEETHTDLESNLKGCGLIRMKERCTAPSDRRFFVVVYETWALTTATHPLEMFAFKNNLTPVRFEPMCCAQKNGGPALSN